MNRTKLIAGLVTLLVVAAACAAQEAELFPDPAEPTELLECETYKHLELSGADYEAISSTPTNATFELDV